MVTYHSKLAYGIRKYFPGFAGLADWGGTDFTASSWEKAIRLNYGGSLVREAVVPLQSVFQFLKTGDTAGSKVFPYAPLSIKPTEPDTFFPTGTQTGSFEKLKEDFNADWDKVKTYSPNAAGETLLFLAKKYLSKVGCSAEKPYISAFEHIKTTAALAECMERSPDGNLLLVGVGLDNIQGFCYDIVSSKAAKSLKGRSFYLQMLLDTIAQDIICDPAIGAELGHIVYARGGKMYLILPGTEDVKDALVKIQKRLIEVLWKRFKTSLYCYLQFISFTPEDTDQTEIWETLKSAITNDRKRKYRTLLTPEFKNIFTPIEEGFDTEPPESNVEAEQRALQKKPVGHGKPQFCRVTGALIANALHPANNLEPKSEDPPIWVSTEVKLQAELGERLRETDLYSLYRQKNEVSIPDETDILYTGSDKFVALPEMGTGKKSELLKQLYKETARRTLNDTAFLSELVSGVAYGFSFYGGNKQPTWIDEDDGNIEKVKDYEKLAGLKSQEDVGGRFTRLGVARMDLDNLSDLADLSNSSFALNASFSAQLDLFLSGYINTIWANPEKKYKDFVNIVFAGGDDMLLVGRWDYVLDFMVDFRTDFHRFIGDCDNFTLSAGISLVTPKFPISKAVEMAGEAQLLAKNHRCAGTTEKNALCFMDHPLHWEHEFPVVRGLKDQLVELVQKKVLPKSLMMGLATFYEQKKEQKKLGKTATWRWQVAYQLKRHKERAQSKASEEFIEQLSRDLMTDRYQSKPLNSSYEYYDLLHIAIRWAEYTLRVIQDEMNKNNSNIQPTNDSR